MSLSRRQFAGLATATALSAPAVARATPQDLAQAQRNLIYGTEASFEQAIQTLRAHGDPDVAAGLILGLRYTRGARPRIVETLEQVTGHTGPRDWFDWMLWQEANPQIRPHPSYIEFKRNVFLSIDPNFDDFLQPSHIQPDAMRIRLEEITWGGVRKDGIPSLDNPNLISALEADYLQPDDLVFGVSINGDARAYPLRIMGWHEMFNEVIGGVPVALAYCTLCGSGILFETQLEGRAKPLVFGSSGFLYRSNKLMFDRETHSLWNQFTGQPVVGALADSGIALKQRPVVITTWDAWEAANPKTQVLSLRTGHRRDYGSGVVYRDYFGSPDLMFPAQVDQTRHRQKDYIFGIRTFGAAKAWPLEVFAGGRVINDAIGDTKLVLIGDAASRSVRAYERGALRLSRKDGALQSQDGTTWTETEEALTAPDGRRLARVAGHIAYWFAWDGYLGARSELYQG